jgi:hypothetical protein
MKEGNTRNDLRYSIADLRNRYDLIGTKASQSYEKLSHF